MKAVRWLSASSAHALQSWAERKKALRRQTSSCSRLSKLFSAQAEDADLEVRHQPLRDRAHADLGEPEGRVDELVQRLLLALLHREHLPVGHLQQVGHEALDVAQQLVREGEGVEGRLHVRHLHVVEQLLLQQHEDVVGVLGGEGHEVGLEGEEEGVEGGGDGGGTVDLQPVPAAGLLEEGGVGVEAEAVLPRLALVLRHLQNHRHESSVCNREYFI